MVPVYVETMTLSEVKILGNIPEEQEKRSGQRK
jgi:hypothetical protein